MILWQANGLSHTVSVPSDELFNQGMRGTANAGSQFEISPLLLTLFDKKPKSWRLALRLIDRDFSASLQLIPGNQLSEEGNAFSLSIAELRFVIDYPFVLVLCR